MSLHKFAEQVAANGRGDDSLLVHMTPDEVQRLQKFAEANGRTLTINPETGLPEAGFLSDLFKAVAPIALGAFLGPAGAAIGGGFMSAGMAGLAVGGITTLATGSLSRGLMAGLGAYGGAGLGESLMNAGSAGMASTAGATAGAEAAQQGLSEAARSQAIDEAVRAQGFNEAVGKTAASDVFGAGVKSAMANPMAFAKQNLGNLAYAAAPIMAGAMVPTTTQAPTGKNENYIRQFDFNIDPETGKPNPLYGLRTMAPVKANEWKDKTFQGQRDLFRQQNPNPYELGVGSLNQAPQQQQPTPMATGGIVALAIGGDTKTALEAAYAANDVAKINEIASANKITAADIADTYKGFDTSGIQGLQLYAPPAAPTYNQFTNEQIGSYLTANPNVDINKAIAETNADPNAVNQYIASLTSPFVGSTDTKGGSGTLGIYSDMVAKGVDPTEYYTAALANDPKYGGWSKDMIQKGYNLDKGAYALSAQIEKDKIAADPKLGYDKQWVNFMDTNNYSIDDMAQAFGLSRNEVKARYDAVKNAEKKTTVVGGTGTDVITKGPGSVTSTVLDTNPTTNAPIGTTNPYGNINNPGDLTFNNDGTVTVQPNIPGRPYGGFSGIQEIKDAYTKGGGSLGYTSRAPRTIDEFNQLYNRQTGDSLAAYDYLMGKGGGKYPAKSMASQIAVPYAEYALGKKTVGLKPITKTTGTSTTTFKEPQTYFDEKAYLAANPDVEAEMKAGKSNFASAYEHWLRYGKAEGRKFAGDYDSYLSAVEADKARIANAANSANAGGDDGGAAAAAAAAASAADSAAASAASASGTAPGSDGSPGSGAKRGGLMPRGYAIGGGLGSLGSYSDGGRLLKGPGDGVSDSIPATIGRKQQPARLADGEFVIPARIVSELGNGSTDAGAKKLYAMMDRVQRARGKTTGKNKVAANSRSDKYLPA